MSVSLPGFDALVQELTNAPQEIRAEAMAIIRDTTEAAATEIRDAYPTGPTGNLKSRVKALFPASSVLVGIVSSTAPHSHLWEFGTKVRQTKSGANRGTMPAHKGRSEKVTPVIAQRHRLSMMQRLMDMLRSKGFEVHEG